MSSIRDYFNSDLMGNACEASTFSLRPAPNCAEVIIHARLHLNIEANARFVSFYLPPISTPDLLAVIGALGDAVDLLLEKPVAVQGVEKHRETASSSDLRFTGRVFIYAETELTKDEVAEATQLLRKRGLFLLYRGPGYALERDTWRRPVAFISYDSSDRDTVAAPLAEQLDRLHCRTWFDGYAMRAGDDIERSIAKGLTDCERCILILSECYLANQRWARREFDAIHARELREGRSLMIPIRYGVSERDVAKFSNTLANRRSIDWDPARIGDIAHDLSIALLSVGRDDDEVRFAHRGPMSWREYAGLRLGLTLGRVFRRFTARRGARP